MEGHIGNFLNIKLSSSDPIVKEALEEERWWPPQQGKPGDLLLAVDDEPLQQRHGDGGDAQELVARWL